ncbi:MAG TPA: hypothetical protein VLQ79_03000, partial [Myxococcaceae bacterium]|nr:hypothetical protein [Myxococcaceae bacterium]
VAFYPQLAQFSVIRVEARSGFDVGLASWTSAVSESHSPDEWRASLEVEVNTLLRLPPARVRPSRVSPDRERAIGWALTRLQT